ncbi:hypothetical protein JG687_00016435 [Phytophthora cactorum]|uniref:Uncharacterized protein n=1 Tax=Phytophthora cactorum TaxID=29920 RepID=A0A8T1TS59_9STRA|nr:hypothetical protein PC114_g5523 [Phytophthora cactorum]KAG3031907.1 hypothetical protein PC120_g2825 [Phytophthora cactorum]KAG3035262.1 hypothetical protein PC119_g4663 [Phytophthora cactorum]KAG3179749.1 hypothetical protein C6341_g7341 [Phytophthora cactorum]KAG3195102.1 hypothetical protein PC128_g8779 [Phytophthora cactorum]
MQQDNATPHASAYSETVKTACRSDGWNISFVNQPSRSLDFNVLDLGVFFSIRALQY